MSAPALSASAPDKAVSLWPAFGLGLAVAVGNGLARFAYALVLPAMQDDLGWTYTQAGWLNTANALGYVIGAAAGYVLLRRVAPARLFASGLWLTMASLLATGLLADEIWLTATRLLAGIGAAWAFSCGGALVAMRYRGRPEVMGTATGLFFAGAGIGIAAAGLAVNPLLATTGVGGWPQAWLALGALAVALSAWPLVEARRGSGGAASDARPGPLSLSGLLRPLASYFLFAAGYIVYMTFILAFLREEGWSWHGATAIWLVLGAAVAISPFAWRPALERWDPRHTLAASCAACLAGTGILLLDTSALALVVSALAFGLGVFIAPASVALVVRRAMPPADLAKGMTFFTILFALGQAIGPVAAGLIGDASGLSRSLGFGACLLGAAAILPLVSPRAAEQPPSRPGDPT
ncbi:YbfB/YjiJ family MFS transporter [Salinarimonas ramus]|uniref:MFS transporter n=1 Tax=Salinarimonas ramus TaxID=690164 RepID=A0A917Q514_9HYPH|nr:YbfB/YjiJ family MFS transporter [Salinarimonas ramus]GGK25590.1 MFS transporter [Salinarimonas ramus]